MPGDASMGRESESRRVGTLLTRNYRNERKRRGLPALLRGLPLPSDRWHGLGPIRRASQGTRELGHPQGGARVAIAGAGAPRRSVCRLPSPG